MFTAREMQAIKSLLIGENGVNIAPLVADLTAAREEEVVNTDEMSVKVAILLSGKMPEFKPYVAYKKGWNGLTEIEVVGESSLEETYKLNYTRRWKFNKEKDVWELEKDFKPYKAIEKIGCTDFISKEELAKIKFAN